MYETGFFFFFKFINAKFTDYQYIHDLCFVFQLV